MTKSRRPAGRPRRVLIVYHHLPHYRYDVFRKLEELPGFEVEFAAAPESRDGSILTIPAEALRRFHPLRNLWVGPLLWQRGSLGLVLRRRPDVVVFLGVCTYLSSWVAAVLARPLGAAVLHWTIGWHRPDRGVKRLFRLAFYRLASRLLVYGRFGRDIGVAMGYPAERMRVVYNSSSEPMGTAVLEEGRLAAFAAALPQTETPLVGAVLRLDPVKRLDLLIRAAAGLRAGGRLIGVLLVGDGPEREALVALAAKLDVPLWLPGPAYGDHELAEVYARLLVSVVPSAAGLTVLQSLKYGRPVITHDNMHMQGPECEAIEPGVTGDLYPWGNLESLQTTLACWLDRQLTDPEKTARNCRAALDAAWNAEVSARIIGEELGRAIASSTATGRLASGPLSRAQQ